MQQPKEHNNCNALPLLHSLLRSITISHTRSILDNGTQFDINLDLATHVAGLSVDVFKLTASYYKPALEILVVLDMTIGCRLFLLAWCSVDIWGG